ncbi:acyl carrier protein [Azospirillum sp.]|uniref:acyl carrier protein n=1 Tax=Azospirillum sp. TaxID=34012 RepID=UPI002D628AFC|nr:acyl carrier protein [Azospirillum sp.]HYD70517.1 acyl carrier protein [Azospirillum sp.]
MTPLELVIAEAARIIEDKGETVPSLGSDTAFLDGDLPFDSLDLATLVVVLEQKTGRDPFREGLRQFRTVGELAALYAPLHAP